MTYRTSPGNRTKVMNHRARKCTFALRSAGYVFFLAVPVSFFFFLWMRGCLALGGENGQSRWGASWPSLLSWGQELTVCVSQHNGTACRMICRQSYLDDDGFAVCNVHGCAAFIQRVIFPKNQPFYPFFDISVFLSKIRGKGRRYSTQNI